MIASRARVRRRPASSQPTPSSRRRDPSPLATARLAVTSTRRGDGADAERERVVAAVAAAERAQQAREKRAERAMIASRARVRRRPASSQPTPSSRRRDPSPLATARLAVTSRRGDGADAERERVVAAVAAAERAHERAEKRAERAMIAPRARVRRRPASSQPTPSSRRRDPSPLATARLAVTSNTPEDRERAGTRSRRERRGDEHRAPFGAGVNAFVLQRPEEENGACVRSEHSALCQRCDRHTRKPRIDTSWTDRGIVVALERHERVRGDLELRRQHARRELGCKCEHALKEACLTRRWPVQPAIAVGPCLERCEGGRRQAGSEVDREAAVLDPAEPAEEEDDNVQR